MTIITPRRTQQSRRESTIGKLIESTISCINELGFQGTSVQIICQRAGLSQGALFRHFATKNELMEAVYCKTSELLFAQAQKQINQGQLENESEADRLLDILHSLSLNTYYTVLAELMVSARTQSDLAKKLDRHSLAYRDTLLDMLGEAFPMYAGSSEFHIMVLSLLNMLHGLALYRSITPDAQIEEGWEIRRRWLKGVIEMEFSRIRKIGPDLDNPEFLLPRS